MHRPDAGTGQQGNGQLRDHGQVDTHPVPFADALLLQHIGHPADLFMELPVGDVPGGLARIIGLEQKGRFVPPGGQVPVQAVFSDIQLCALKPGHFRQLEIPAEHPVPFLPPDKMLFSDLFPEGLRVPDGFPVYLKVLLQVFDVVIAHK